MGEPWIMGAIERAATTPLPRCYRYAHRVECQRGMSCAMLGTHPFTTWGCPDAVPRSFDEVLARRVLVAEPLLP